MLLVLEYHGHGIFDTVQNFVSEIQELIDNCTWIWTTYNGVEGNKVTGPNGNNIFLPGAGYRYGTSIDYNGPYGYYWSSAFGGSNSNYAVYLFFPNGCLYWLTSYSCSYGYSVRPVSE